MGCGVGFWCTLNKSVDVYGECVGNARLLALTTRRLSGTSLRLDDRLRALRQCVVEVAIPVVYIYVIVTHGF